MSEEQGNDLLLAILAIDSYNRGYGESLKIGGTSLGTITINTDSEEVFRIPGAEDGSLSPAAVAGFYAVAYDVPGLGTVISYRGTDEELKDAWNGWSSIVGGVPEQARLAAQFYNSVRKDLDEIAFCRLQHTI